MSVTSKYVYAVHASIAYVEIIVRTVPTRIQPSDRRDEWGVPEVKGELLTYSSSAQLDDPATQILFGSEDIVFVP